MTLASSVLGIIPGLQSVALLGPNLKLAEDSLKMKKVSPKGFVKVGVTNLIGISLIKPTASMISSL